MFESKVRQVGDSLGVLIPIEILQEAHIKKDEIVQIAIIKKDFSRIERMFGIAKGAKPYQRDRNDRVF